MRGVERLKPEVSTLAVRLVEECGKQGLVIQITDTLRTKDEQDALYAQGRTKPGSIVTNAKYPQSNHCWGIAFDFCRNDGEGAFNDNDGFFSKVGQVGKGIGLSWGGDWISFKDKPHFEYEGYGLWRALSGKYGAPGQFLGNSDAPVSAPTTSNLLKAGSRGQAVTDLQNRLNGLGFSSGKADGIFGSSTEQAVKAFQQSRGLEADGIVGDKTRSALESAQSGSTPSKGSEIIKRFQGELNSQFKKGLAVDGIWGSNTQAAAVNVRKGAKGNITKILQEALTVKGYSIGVDGIFGQNTHDAVMAFQKRSGLSADGIVGSKTWKALLN